MKMECISKDILLLFPLALHLSKSVLNQLTIDSHLLFWVTDIAVYVIVPFIFLYMLAHFFNVSPSQYGLFRSVNKHLYEPKDFFTDVIFAILFLFLVSYVSFYMAYAIWQSEEIKDIGSVYTEIINQYDFPAYISAKIYLSVTAGITEEIIYRGILYLVIANVIRPVCLANWSYIILSSFLFSLAHIGYSIVGLVSVTCFGVAASLLYINIRRLEPLIIAHILYDLAFL